MEKIVLPEYGRNIQQMAQYILTIKDREQRNIAAQEIITVMGNMTPQYKDSRDFKQKLWDHLALMTNYKLDVDYPYEINIKSRISKSEKLQYNNKYIPFRHYGRIVHQMVRKAIEIEDVNERHELILLIANQMKKMYVQWNNNTVNDEVILQDLRTIAGDRIKIDNAMKLNSVKVFNNFGTNSNNNTNNRKGKYQNNNNNNRKGKRR